jgi:feruloyl esterase
MTRTVRGAAIAGACALLIALSLTPTMSARTGQSARCDRARLDGLDVPGLTIQGVDTVAAGGFTAPRSNTSLAQTPSFCRVHATVSSTPDSRIVFEVWIPERWNGKMVVTGNGGYSNALTYPDMVLALSEGYAAVGGDSGHQTSTPDDLLWGVDHPQRIIDWGTASIHTITEPSKRIIERLEGRSPARAYYYGCSTGGHQGYAEIQRYPQDFDGVIAGAPGSNRVRLNAAFLWQFVANRDKGVDSPPIIPAAKLPIINKAVVAACDALDGVADEVVDDPRRCSFNPASLTCKSADDANCLTAPQVTALNKLYGGAKNPRTGEQIYPGWPKSSEALTVNANGFPGVGWHLYWGGNEPARANFWRYWVFNDPKWNWWTFDFDRDVTLADDRVGRMIDQVNPDISAFAARGGKAIVYQGWQDPVVNALDTVAYYEKVKAHQGSQEKTDAFFRLFLVPGMGHCSGGPGTTSFGNQGAPAPVTDAQHDLLSALDAWVEKGTAPERIIASHVVNGATTRTRPLCLYPRRAVYTGTGSTDAAENFVCS